MDGSLLAYVLPVVAVAVLAGGCTAILRSVEGIYRLALAHRPTGSADLTLRRCERCGRGWRTDGRLQPTALGLHVRRSIRRRQRERDRGIPSWVRAQGWSRCPSCLSTRVRTTGEPALPGPLPSRGRRLVVAGFAAASVGLLLLGVAGLSVLTAGPV